jgi:hypothetical protein
LSEQQIATRHPPGNRGVERGTEPAPVLHRFVSLANEPDFLRLGWMRERPLRPPVQNFGVWLMWPCVTCLPVEPPSGAVCGGSITVPLGIGRSHTANFRRPAIARVGWRGFYLSWQSVQK